MKGVILGINPQCTLVDITHEVMPQDVEGGALILANAGCWFPKGTIHLSVVDPGVGGKRKPILFVTHDYFFLGPDNGLLALAARKDGVKEAIELTNPKFFLPRVSTTFHGRDIFAPVAAYLSRGIQPGMFGPKLNSWVALDFEEPSTKGQKLQGKVLRVDAFGNLITNVSEGLFSQFVQGRPFVIRVAETAIAGLKQGYWERRKGQPIALMGSAGYLEISVREGSAQKLLKIKKGDKVFVETFRRGRDVPPEHLYKDTVRTGSKR